MIVGFALSTLNADNLVAISDDVSKFCMYKQPIVAGLYAILTIFSIGACMTCLGLSFYIIFRSQQTANEVSVTHTVALVRQLQRHIVAYYLLGMFAFFTSMLLLVWMYFGRHNWIPLEGEPGPNKTTIYATGSMSSGPTSKTCSLQMSGFTGNPSCDSYMANGWDVQAVSTDTGQMLMTCLNPYNTTHQDYQREVGTAIASAVTAAFFCVGMIAFCSLYRVQHAFRAMCELPEVKAMSSEAPGGRTAEFIQMIQTGAPRSNEPVTR